jgi:drug/metabolite transporter (DMT)-like permease
VSDRARVWSALWTVYIVWGSTYLAIAVAVETIQPLFAVSTRFIAAGAIMAFIVTRRGGTMRASRREIASCVLIGCLLPGANAVLFFAERNVPTGLASLLIASVPLWVVVLRLVGRERLPLPALVGVGVGFAGVAVLAQPSGGATAWGIGLCVLSSVMWSVGSVLSARLPMPADPFAATAWEMLGGGVAMLPLGIATMGTFSPSTSSILGWVYLVTVGSIVGYTAYVWLLASAPLGLVSTYAYVNPVVAIVLGVLFRGEHLDWRLAVGAVIVVAAVALVVRQEPPAATHPEEGSLASSEWASSSSAE